jgi:hypothetical protein
MDKIGKYYIKPFYPIRYGIFVVDHEIIDKNELEE